MKRLSNRVSPYTHDVVTTLIKDSASRLVHGSNTFLIAKQLLADLPIVPTGERTYELAQQLQMGLLDDICPLEEVKQHWQQCLNKVADYLRSIGILLSAD